MSRVRLHVLSDLHLEHAPFAIPDVDADVVVLAGDIAPGTAGIDWAARQLPGRTVLYVAGNHEFYGHDLPGLTDRLRAAARGSTIHVLENDAVVIDGVRFLGCSLWSDFDHAGIENRANSMALCERLINDYKQIRSSEGRRLLARDTRDLHVASRAWLATCLADAHDGPTVVVTHHAPLVRRREAANAVLDAIAGGFASDLTELMGTGVALWVFGHTHRCIDTDVHGTRVLSNQRGYPHEPVVGFDPALVVEL